MNKIFKNCWFSILLTISLGILIIPTVVFASESDNVSYNEVEHVGIRVEKYLVMDETYLYFDYDSAQKNNEPQEVIDQGLLLESTSNYFNSDGTALEKGLKIQIPVWGNYCGPGYSGDDFTKEAQDILDEGCKNHDMCYKWGLSLTQNCECNRALIKHIDDHKNEMSGKMAKVAWAIRTYFSTVGMVGC